MDIKVNISKLKEIIVSRKDSQLSFCTKLDITPASIVRTLQGKNGLSVENIIKIADYAKIVDIRELLIYENKNKNNGNGI